MNSRSLIISKFRVERRENLRRAVGLVSENLFDVYIFSMVSLYLGIVRWGKPKAGESDDGHLMAC